VFVCFLIVVDRNCSCIQKIRSTSWTKTNEKGMVVSVLV